MSQYQQKASAPSPKNLRPRWFAPEVVQTSAMDCGPAALKCLLEGFGVQVNYDRLREVCQTDVDGTSIDTLEEVAQQLGLLAEQVVVPADHVLLPETNLLPALAVVQHPNGLTHFVIIWRKLGNFVQVMDPANGRVWKSTQQVLQELYIHSLPVASGEWREWAITGDFLVGLRLRLARLGLSKIVVENLIEFGLHDAGWHTLAALDASTRLVTSLVQNGGIKRGQEAQRLLDTFLEQACQEDPAIESKLIPANYWSVRPLDSSITASKEKEVAINDPTLVGQIAANATNDYRQEQLDLETVQNDRDAEICLSELALVPEPVVSSGNDENQEQEENNLQVLLRGAVLLRILAPSSAANADNEPVATTSDTTSQEQTQNVATQVGEGAFTAELPLSQESVTALAQSPSRPGLELLQLLKADGLLTPAFVVMLLLLAAGGIVAEAILLRGLLDIGQNLAQASQRLMAILSLLIFMAAITGLNGLNTGNLLRIGRRLEIRLRAAFLEHIPQIRDRYFQTRPVSDMAERSHSVYQMRFLPTMGGKLLRLLFELLLITLGLIWLDPASTPLILLLSLYGISLPFLPQPFILGQELKVRTFNGALSRFYLEGLRGLSAIRAHKAERAVRREHEKLMAGWKQAIYHLHMIKTVSEAIQFTFIIALIGWLVLDHLSRPNTTGSALLFVYWAISIWTIAVEIAPLARQYPTYRNITFRLLELLTSSVGNENVPLNPVAKAAEANDKKTRPNLKSEIALDRYPTVQACNREGSESGGVSIKLENVSVQAAGHSILHNIDLQIEAGSHLAIIGPSGAGKSSLVGLLLGWHAAVEGGSVLVDGTILDSDCLQRLRQETAWVDPAVQLWNRSLLENLHYGLTDSFTNGNKTPNMSQIITQADLVSILERLPFGLQTQLGEGGALVSGGEGQRIRLGRAMLRPDVRLVILDEPFRGLDREKRHKLLAFARQLWRDTTMLCITHDISETQQFDRILVMEDGRIVEDEMPGTLAAHPNSRYRALLDAETAVHESLLRSTQWRRLYVANGQLIDNSIKNISQNITHINHDNENHNGLTEGYYVTPNHSPPIN